MTFLSMIARAVQLAYTIVKAAVGILLVAHGTYRWVQKRRAAAV